MSDVDRIPRLLVKHSRSLPPTSTMRAGPGSRSYSEHQCKFTFLLFYVHMTVHSNKLLFNETNRHNRFQIYSGTKLYMFQAVPLPIIRS